MPQPVIALEALGWNAWWEESFQGFRAEGLEPGRVAAEDKHFYVLLAAQGELTAQVAGKLLHQTSSPAGLPKVGDWAAFTQLPNESKAVIHHLLPRRTKLSRKVAGRELEEQVLAVNVDSVFVVQALDRTFNLALLQRHLVMVFESGASPVVVLNKADLCSDSPAKRAQAEQVSAGASTIVVSARTGEGLDELRKSIRPAETIVFLGASGVGKSTLINVLCGEDLQPTAEVRESDAKGRHTTSWRELIMLPQGGLVIDTPGVREFQMWSAREGLREAFSDLDALAAGCRFRDCTHSCEKGCAVLEALASGQLSQARYKNYLKLSKELACLARAQTRQTWFNRKRRTQTDARAVIRFKRRPRQG